MTTHESPTYFMKVSAAAVALFGTSDRAACERVRRLVDAGEIASVRTGSRGDRLIPYSEITRLLNEAEQNRSLTSVSDTRP